MSSSVPVYVINLARSSQRWDDVKQSADQFGIELRRVEAVEGKQLKADELGNFDEAGFRRRHGKIALPAEIGCYFSHIKALETIAAAPEAYAVIAEDDVLFTPDFLPFISSVSKLQGWDVIKLVNHRTAAYRRFNQVEGGNSIGRCLHGPLGSSAAYLVTRNGAIKLLEAIKPMSLPYDVALERGWAGDYEFFLTEQPLVALRQVGLSTIADGRNTYAKARLPAYKRLSTLLFRTTDYIRRIAYALRIKRLGVVDS
ncbi:MULTISPECIES: glycosyltransferase family 25 protein [Ochrobactrum]|uniref:Glycosyltransferase family 25 protein n=1 Tax=Ochrobactrum chromiisoli TaxID=2993941 RepID=A0ABT3QJZ5_9HYPH|nr:glycosyltransferase family 25 protein [Ochrobactrum chromiisoli]MCX2695936.1 glycosyltransferase family 25 protein [Ochrobactrum chromiisoli]